MRFRSGLTRSTMAIALALLASAGTAAADVVRVAPVTVTVRSETAVHARAEVFRTAKLRALAKVRGVSAAGLDQEAVDRDVAYIEVLEEVVAPGRYTGVFAVGVDTAPADVTRTYGRQGSAVASWVLVIPAHQAANEARFWDLRDPWSRAWLNAGTRYVRWVTTPADDPDRHLLSLETLGRYGALALSRIAEKYAAPAVVLAALDTRRSSVTRVHLVGWTPATGRYETRFDVARDPSSPSDAHFADVRRTVVADLLATWLVPARSALRVEIPVGWRDAWRERRALLEAIPGVKVARVRRNEERVLLDLTYAGSRQNLIGELHRRGYLD